MGIRSDCQGSEYDIWPGPKARHKGQRDLVSTVFRVWGSSGV